MGSLSHNHRRSVLSFLKLKPISSKRASVYLFIYKNQHGAVSNRKQYSQASTYKDVEYRSPSTLCVRFIFSEYYWLLFVGITVPFLACDRRRFLYDMRVPVASICECFYFFPSRMSCFGVAVDLTGVGACLFDCVRSQFASFFAESWLNPCFSERSLASPHGLVTHSLLN